MLAAVMSIMVLAVIVLLLGAFALWRRGGARKQVGLMVLLAAIIAANVAIWAIPDPEGRSLIGEAADQ